VQHISDDRAEDDSADADEEALAELVEMLDERRLLAVVEPARDSVV
jgi:hypothetical protein